MGSDTSARLETVKASRGTVLDMVAKLLVVTFVAMLVGIPLPELMPWMALAAGYAAVIGWIVWEFDPTTAIGVATATFFQFFGWMLGLVGTDHFDGKDYPGLYALSIGVCGGVSLVTASLGFLPLSGRGYRAAVLGATAGGLASGFLMALGVTPGFRFLFVVFRLTGGLMNMLPALCGLSAMVYVLRDEWELDDQL